MDDTEPPIIENLNDNDCDNGTSYNKEITVKLERGSPTPSLCKNNAIQSNNDNNISPNDNTTYNYDLKISSPISWALESIKTEKSSIINSPESQTVSTSTTAIETPTATTTTTTTTTTPIPTTANVHTVKKTKRLQSQLHQSNLGSSINLRNKKIKSLKNQSKNQNTNDTIFTTLSNTSRSTASSSEKKYRIMFQNHRIRKESLEHGEDMIYNPDIEKPWICKNCNRNYKWKNSLKCHLKNECGLPPRYFCNKMCGYRTNVHSNLKRHLNTKCKTKDDDDNRNNQH